MGIFNLFIGCGVSISLILLFDEFLRNSQPYWYVHTSIHSGFWIISIVLKEVVYNFEAVPKDESLMDGQLWMREIQEK